MRPILGFVALILSFSAFSQEEVSDSCSFYVPGIVTPDCDGDCSSFQIYSSCPMYDFELKVYNTSEELVFESFDSDKKWYPLGKNPDGEYYWTLSYTDLYGITKIENGTLVILH